MAEGAKGHGGQGGSEAAGKDGLLGRDWGRGTEEGRRGLSRMEGIKLGRRMIGIEEGMLV